ncbi:MAG: GAF domain-containing protein [Deltaproteobacteria bacterium]|nr:GAF domain-containing protein [Deltaproteobacteria bacterium]
MDVTAPQVSSILPGVVDDILSTFALALRARAAAALILDADGTSCRTIASWGLTDGDRERIGRWSTIGDEARPYWEQLAAAARPVYVTTPRADARRPWQGVADVPPHLATPLIGGNGRLLGVILLDTTPPHDEDLIVAAKVGRLAAIAIEQTRAAEARALELTRSAVLLDIVREVDRPVELPEVLAAICRKTVEAFGSRQATVFFYSRRHRASLPLADYGTPAHVVPRFAGGRYMKGNIPHEDEVATGRTVVIERADTAPAEDIALLDLIEVSTLVMVPLRHDDGTVRGLLSVGFTEARACTPEELSALEMVARHAVMAIMRARFLHRTAESARFRAAVSSLAVELNAATTRTETLQTLCARGCEIFGVDTAVLLLEAGDRLVATAACGELAASSDLVVALDGAHSPVTRAFHTRVVVHENDRPRRDDGAPLDRLRSVLAIPLIASEGPIGVLVFGALRPRRFRPNVVEEAPLLGALAAAVLHNAALMGQLHDSNQRLGRLSALKDQFLANVSHDLRTPLNVIIGYAQLALEDTFGAPPTQLREILERMLSSARQQLVLVQDLLDVSRLELNGLAVKLAPMSLAPLFVDMEFLATSLVRHKPVRVVVDLPDQNVWVHADADRLRQILTNLLANAAKFTDEGTIGLGVVGEAEHVRIDVVDSGIGIPTDELESIFEPFRQVDGARAGLGLAIAHRLTQLMHGTLTVESTLGRGSRFSLTLPAVRPADRSEVASTSASIAS